MEYESWVRHNIIHGRHSTDVMTGPLTLRLSFFMPIPKSWSKKKQRAAAEGKLLPAGKPDADNLEKAVIDASNGLLWKDDAQITDKITIKRYGEEPGVVITVTEIETHERST